MKKKLIIPIIFGFLLMTSCVVYAHRIPKPIIFRDLAKKEELLFLNNSIQGLWDISNGRYIEIGNNEPSTDYSLTFAGESNAGSFVWMEDENYFLFNDAIKLPAATASLASLIIPEGTSPSSPSSGDIWNDSTQKTVIFYIDGIKQYIGGTVFVQTADKTVANSNTETTLVSSGVGTTTLPANFFVSGKSIRISAGGHYSTTNPAGTLRIKVKLGSTIVLDTGANTLTNGISSLTWNIEPALMTCRTTGSSGTVMAQGFIKFATTHTTATVDDFSPNTSAVVIDTTIAQDVSITAQFGTSSASNTITCTNFLITSLN